MQTYFWKLQNNEQDVEVMQKAAEFIQAGEVVAFPTETVYGLGGNALDADAGRKIFEAKGRPGDNPLIVHVEKPEDAEAFAYTSEAYYKLADALVNGRRRRFSRLPLN